MLKEQKGITLVALVITIIVLLILAGVSISLVIGNNGVLSQASTAVDKTRNAEIKQAVQLAIQTAETNYYAAMAEGKATSRGDTNAKYDDSFKAELGNQGYTVSYEGSILSDSTDVTVKLEKDSASYTIAVHVVPTTGVPSIDDPVVVP